MRGRRGNHSRVIAIFRASGHQKSIAFAHGVSQGYVSRIKSGQLFPEVTAPYRQSSVMALNAALTTLAFTGAP